MPARLLKNQETTMFAITDTEAVLLMDNASMHRQATANMNVANGEIRRLRAELAAIKKELAKEKARRHAAEFAARRH